MEITEFAQASSGDGVNHRLFSPYRYLYEIVTLLARDFGFVRSHSSKKVNELSNLESFVQTMIYSSTSESGSYLALLIVIVVFKIFAILILLLEIKRGTPKNKIQEELLSLRRAVILETSLDRPIRYFVNALEKLIDPDDIESILRISRKQVLAYLRPPARQLHSRFWDLTL